VAKLKSMKALKRNALKAWGAVILKRNPVCLVCKGAKSKHPHHLFSRARNRHLHFDLRNGAGLCIKCHYQIHYDPILPLIRVLNEKPSEEMASLINDAVHGRRKNPYTRKELENITLALKAA